MLVLGGAGLEGALQFLRWLTTTVSASVHPGAPHSRQQAALEIMRTLLDVWDDRVRSHSVKRKTMRDVSNYHLLKEKKKQLYLISYSLPSVINVPRCMYWCMHLFVGTRGWARMCMHNIVKKCSMVLSIDNVLAQWPVRVGCSIRHN